MPDPSLCNRSDSYWLAFKSMLASWLMTPALVLLAIAGLTLMPWILLKLRCQRLLIRLGSVLCLIYLIATFPLTISLANKGLVAFLPNDPGRKADAIVVLGRGYHLRPSRIEIAAKLWQTHRAPLIFASGLGDGAEIVKQLRAKGIPKSALDDENCSRTTEENAIFTASALQSRQVKKILLVTDSPHMLRSLLTFNSLGFEVFPHPSPLPSNLATSEKSMMVFYEYMGLVSYSLKGYLLPVINERANFQVAKLRQLRSVFAN